MSVTNTDITITIKLVGESVGRKRVPKDEYASRKYIYMENSIGDYLY